MVYVVCALALSCALFLQQTSRSSRVLLNVKAGAPIILLPSSSRTDDLLVVNLGRLTLTNEYVLEQPTIPMDFDASMYQSCMETSVYGDLTFDERHPDLETSGYQLNDSLNHDPEFSNTGMTNVMNAELEDMDIFSATRANIFTSELRVGISDILDKKVQ